MLAGPVLQNNKQFVMLITNKEAASLLLLDLVAVCKELALDGFFCNTAFRIVEYGGGLPPAPTATVLPQPVFVIEPCY
jgi:hypothetical protein